jgi:hypothetical protein
MQKRIWGLFFLSFAVASSLLADEQETHEIALPPDISPWFTGPLLTRSAYTVAPPHWSLQPYLYYTVFTGTYDAEWKSHSAPNFYTTTLQIQIKRGLAEGFDIQFFPQIIYNETLSRGYCNVGDLPVGFGIRLLDSTLEDHWPAMRLAVRANVPIGKYQHLNPHRKGTDTIGSGSWLPSISFHTSKMWKIATARFFDVRLACGYQIGTQVHVKGYNAYGGVSNTNGTVYPGNLFFVNAAIQCSMTHRWAFACDIVYHHSNKTRFSGKGGSSMTSPSNEQFSLAPAIEYNWSKNFGIIGGVWFTFAGRNANQFTSGIIALSMYK